MIGEESIYHMNIVENKIKLISGIFNLINLVKIIQKQPLENRVFFYGSANEKSVNKNWYTFVCHQKNS